MQYYEDVYLALDLPRKALEVALGNIAILSGDTVPFMSDGFPPALIPISSDDFGYYGFWRHWFCDRATTIVRFKVGDHMLAHEIARTFEQFVLLATLRMLCGGLCSDKEAREQLLKFDLSELDFDELMVIAHKTGDDPAGLIEHRLFIENPPLGTCESPVIYPGDFPIPRHPLLSERDNVAGFEVSLSDLQQTDWRYCPWLVPPHGYREQKRVFYECLDLGNFAGAWFSLNSPAWFADDARKAIKTLADRVGRDDLTVLAHAWCSERQGVLA